MTRDELAAQLRNIAMLIAMVPMDELIEHCDRARRDIDRADSYGHIFNPTGYRNALYDGSLDDARRQRDIADAILNVRRQIQIREEQRTKALAAQDKVVDVIGGAK